MRCGKARCARARNSSAAATAAACAAIHPGWAGQRQEHSQSGRPGSSARTSAVRHCAANGAGPASSGIGVEIAVRVRRQSAQQQCQSARADDHRGRYRCQQESGVVRGAAEHAGAQRRGGNQCTPERLGGERRPAAAGQPRGDGCGNARRARREEQVRYGRWTGNREETADPGEDNGDRQRCGPRFRRGPQGGRCRRPGKVLGGVERRLASRAAQTFPSVPARHRHGSRSRAASSTDPGAAVPAGTVAGDAGSATGRCPHGRPVRRCRRCRTATATAGRRPSRSAAPGRDVHRRCELPPGTRPIPWRRR